MAIIYIFTLSSLRAFVECVAISDLISRLLRKIKDFARNDINKNNFLLGKGKIVYNYLFFIANIIKYYKIKYKYNKIL